MSSGHICDELVPLINEANTIEAGPRQLQLQLLSPISVRLLTVRAR